MIPENVYGSQKRLTWISSHITKTDTIVDLGCGTGAMITLPLLQSGFRVYGIDEDEKSIEYGRKLLVERGLNPSYLRVGDLRQITNLSLSPDVIIASEVLEHIPEPRLSECLTQIRTSLKPGRTLLVTVPNGYGWFEWESFLWYKARLGLLLKYTLIEKTVHWIKGRLLGRDYLSPHPSTLSESPHVQRFTFESIQAFLRRHGFEIIEAKGSVLFCGPFSDLFFTGCKQVMNFNAILGTRFYRRAAGFFICARTSERR